MTIGPAIRRLEWPPAFDDLVVGDIEILSFNFTDEMISGETLSPPVLEVTTINGEDVNPENIVQSGVEMDATGFIASVLVSGTIPNTGYILAMRANTSMGRKLTVEGMIRIMPAYAL